MDFFQHQELARRNTRVLVLLYALAVAAVVAAVTAVIAAVYLYARAAEQPGPMSLAAVPPGQQLRGWGASHGRHTGPVRVLTEPDDSMVERGDVVVARRTDAAWSPVFLKAGAIVVEQGGPLSHAAIVARELGLPAVVNVPGAVARLLAADVTVASVDGDLGLVIIPVGSAPVLQVPR